jgi:predicted dehydrogenase
MAKTLRWGIIGPGRIAHKFAKGLDFVDGAELTAVGSRSIDRAHAFADEYDIPQRFGSYEELAEQGDVDAIYIATPHPAHADNALLCLNADKAVLCEKPLTVNAAEARRVIDAARQNSVFCMEAMWSRFAPPFTKLRELIATGALGEVRMVHAHFCFRAGWNPDSRTLNPDLAGGGLLDVGVYPISLASMLLGKPTHISGSAHIGETGVDEQAGMVLGYDGGRVAVLSCGVRTNSPKTVTVCGTEAMVTIDNAWWGDRGLTLIPAGGEPECMPLPRVGNGYNYEAEEVARCLADGKLESDIMPLDESLAVMETMDELRCQWGLTYPCE